MMAGIDSMPDHLWLSRVIGGRNPLKNNAPANGGMLKDERGQAERRLMAKQGQERKKWLKISDVGVKNDRVS